MPREIAPIEGKPCRKCGNLVPLDARSCLCGEITDKATFKERAAYEVEQWRAYKARATESATA